MRSRFKYILAALLLLGVGIGAGVDYNAMPPLIGSHVFDSDAVGASLLGGSTNGEVTPISLGTNLSMSGTTLNVSTSGGVKFYSSGGSLQSSGPEIVVQGISGSCSTGSGTPSGCNASISWSAPGSGFTSASSYTGWCDATATGSYAVTGTNFIPNSTTTATVAANITGGGTHTVTFNCTAVGY